MAAPTLTLLNHTSINTAESVTGWTQYDTLDTDIKKEGSNSITGTFRTDATVGYYDAGSAPVTAAGKTFRKWINTTNLPYMDTEANGGYELLCYDGTTTEYKTMFGSDTYFGGWYNAVFDMDSFTTLTLANVQRWGLRVQHTATAKNIDNVWTDAFRYLDGYSMTGGTAIDPITLADIETADRGSPTLVGYGVITLSGGVYFCTGDVQFGTGATTMHFKMDGDDLRFENKPVAAGLYSLSGVGSGSNVTIQNSSTIKSVGTTDATRFLFHWDDANLNAFTCTDSLIVRASTCKFKSGQTVTGDTFNDCGQITHGGASLNDTTVKGYEGTANTSALIYNVNADPDGEMDGMIFEKGTAATHAIEFGLLSPLVMTLRDITCTGYNASDTQNDSTFHFKRTSGTITLNLIGFTGNASYRSDGAVVDIVVSPVTTLIHADDNSGDNLQNARVILESADRLGDYPYRGEVTITRSATTATVAHTAHGMKNNDYAVIRGVEQPEYRGVHQISNVSTNAYDFTVAGSPATPATGTMLKEQLESDYDNSPTTEGTFTGGSGYALNDKITLENGAVVTVDNETAGVVDFFAMDNANQRGGISPGDTLNQVSTTGSGTGFSLTPDTDNLTVVSSGALISGLTDVNGDISVSRTFSANTNMKGSIRKSTSSPRFKPFNLAGNTINKDTGLTVNARMILDE